MAMPVANTKRRSRIRSMARRVQSGAKRLRPFINRRHSSRMKATGLGCNLGTVADLSGGGMRLRCRRRLYDVQRVEVWTSNKRVSLRAEVVWSKRLAFRKFEVGMRFLDLTPQLKNDLNELSVTL